MKNYFFATIQFTGLIIGVLITGSTMANNTTFAGEKKSFILTNNIDTPKKKCVEIDINFDKMDKAMDKVNIELKGINKEAITKDVAAALNLVDMAQINKDIQQSLDKINWEEIKNDVINSLKDIDTAELKLDIKNAIEEANKSIKGGEIKKDLRKEQKKIRRHDIKKARKQTQTLTLNISLPEKDRLFMLI